MANEPRASSSAEEACWKKSFHTSTGYVVWPSSEHVINVTKLSGVRFAALEYKGQGIKERLSERMEVCLRTVI